MRSIILLSISLTYFFVGCAKYGAIAPNDLLNEYNSGSKVLLVSGSPKEIERRLTSFLKKEYNQETLPYYEDVKASKINIFIPGADYTDYNDNSNTISNKVAYCFVIDGSKKNCTEVKIKWKATRKSIYESKEIVLTDYLPKKRLNEIISYIEKTGCK